MGEQVPRPLCPGPIRGELCKWAREHSGLSMREVHLQGGPSPAYQCEVEKGKKPNISRAVLCTWLPILGVTEAFVRGLFPRYDDCPSAYPGSVPGLAASFDALRSSLRWADMRSQEKLKAVLNLVAAADGFSPAVLAYVLSMDLCDVEELRLGPTLIQKDRMGAIAGLVGLTSDELLATASQQQVWNAYGPMMILAYEKGLPVAELQRLIERYRPEL